MAEEKLTPENGAENSAPEGSNTASPPADEEMMPRAEAENLVKALKAEREARKMAESNSKEQAARLEKFGEINP